MRVLHIANWYPSKQHPFKALWVKRHIDSLPVGVENKIYHIEISKGRYSYKVSSEEINHRSYELSLPFQIWRVNEILYSVILIYVLFIRERRSGYNIINFHIAYPLLRYYNLIRAVLKVPTIVSEHWSAYHYHFNLKGSGKLNPIKKIFSHSIPIITVSKSLGDDIKNFSGFGFKNYVLPNIVDRNIFKPLKNSQKTSSDQYFLMVSQWKSPKLPVIAIDGFLKFVEDFPLVKLRIIGYGPQLEEMKIAAAGHPNIIFHGALAPDLIAQYMSNAVALVHPSEYETFSVVCAEALACKCPVIASKVGGIPEFVNSHNGILLEQHDENTVYQAMKKCMIEPPVMSDLPDFSLTTIGDQYYRILQNEIEKIEP